MEKYKEALKQFRENVLLKMFCETQTERRVKPSADFVEMVAKFKWPENVTLEVVEQFRKKYAYHYKLRDCAMMLAEVRRGCITVSWFIHRSVVGQLLTRVPDDLLRQYSAIKLEIAGFCVFFL